MSNTRGPQGPVDNEDIAPLNAAHAGMPENPIQLHLYQDQCHNEIYSSHYLYWPRHVDRPMFERPVLRFCGRRCFVYFFALACIRALTHFHFLPHQSVHTLLRSVGGGYQATNRTFREGSRSERWLVRLNEDSRALA
ncbi:hypothetical protein RRG08_019517 [Elysia crispata]|uniref:Uncharacterized protein n=1 Tax=Elysia crispata TaxID=231223 RepID=A0AAE0YX97_9GAST|nr:hypothetical protein RRG08_019517 [Elysia crispata]